MVRTELVEPDNSEHRRYVGQLVLRPNNSMGWRATTYFLATLMLLSFAIATVFTLHGYWMIIPFTILEMSILSACLYHFLRRNFIQEVVTFTADEVLIEVGRRKPECQRCWQRVFTKVMVQKAKHPWYSNRIALRCREEEREIGSFLTSADNNALVRDLYALIRAADACQTALK